MMKRAWILLLILFAAVTLSGMANAELIVIGTATYNGSDYKLIYEDDQGLIWMDYTFSGLRWPLQMARVSGLNDPGVLTYRFNPGISVSWAGEWRLPKTVDGPRKFSYDGTTAAGFNNTTSEMGHLYYKSLGGVAYYDTRGNPRSGWGKPENERGWGLKDTGPFDNLETNRRYWSCTEYAANPVHAWSFNLYWGMQNNLGFKAAYGFRGLAVRPATVDGR